MFIVLFQFQAECKDNPVDKIEISNDINKSHKILPFFICIKCKVKKKSLDKINDVKYKYFFVTNDIIYG